MNQSKIKTYLLWILLAEAVGGLAGWLIREDVKIYTDSIAQPPLSPPALVFPVAWPGWPWPPTAPKEAGGCKSLACSWG